ncbi:glycosyl hydrolases family 31-domain-containing protein [Dichomitus squalens]|uniref:Glycosyl hydrolases family 31-domain-containing protein n=1 Tax=Dichomitus squalens TaxID=114155 RepID=A0A4Q9Q623_9APHY|nr:glycosyl hydrolases family 31-domain-containing protein [Dichomitus squalens]TBU62416.1 glycosyl hydrolases family 31-domain-containing protein [Dichomitus squalens]
MLATFLGGVLLMGRAARDHLSLLTSSFTAEVFATQETFSRNVSTCPGYTLSSLHETKTGLTAALSLAGPACNAFGHDIANLTLEVTYDTQTRLHVNIYDTAKAQFTIPTSAVELASGSNDPSLKHSSDLVFNHESSPFAFWITRRSEPDAQPLFDTRISSLPPAPIPPNNASDSSTGFDGFPLVFEDQYLQLTSALPLDANVYGLGEVVAASGFRRDVGTDGSPGTIQTMWARDAADPVDENIYGSHPIYLEHRFNETTKKSQSHGVFLFNAAGSDTLLQTPPASPVSLIQYRVVGGVLDLYFLSGPSPQAVVEQYGAVVGLPTWQPLWGFGFHLCRWGYTTVNETREQVRQMRAAGVPLETMWNDIDLYHAFRDFTTDPVSFPIDEVRAFIAELGANNQHYIPIVDAAIAHAVNDTDIYDTFARGTEKDIWIKNPDGSTYIGQVWPGYTVFPDWFAENTEAVWTEAFKNWSDSGVAFSGIWLDMNEVSSFCAGSCGTGVDLSIPPTQVLLPGTPGDLVTEFPEGYNATIWGPSGNMTINGTSTFGNNGETENTLVKRGLGAGQEKQVNLNSPPYAIHNGFGLNDLDEKTIATNATHANGLVEIDTHNLWGLMEEKATHLALLSIHPGKRPFMISRSTFASAGKWTGHWLGDNYSKWAYLHYNIQGVLQFQLFQIPMVGADTCGFNDNTDEELCNRWMQLSAFVPFYRNHNELGAISQEPYRWDSVAEASKTAIAVRYSMLPYWYTLFANASSRGTPPVRALFFEFPDEPELFGIDTQFLIGRDILVTPVLTPNVSSVAGVFPGRGDTVWRDWYTHEAVDVPATPGGNVTLDAPLGHINVHVRDGAVILLYAQPGYTVTETAAGPYSLLVTLDKGGHAFGTAYLDDGESVPPTPNTTLTFRAGEGQLAIHSSGNFHVGQTIDTVTILGVGSSKPGAVKANEKILQVADWEFDEGLGRLVLKDLGLDLNGESTVTWA